MLKYLSLFLLLLPSEQSLAQKAMDSVLARGSSVNTKTETIVNSLLAQATVNRFRDSHTLNAWSDTLRRKVDHRFSANFLKRYGDSLRSIGVPKLEIGRRTESLLMRKAALMDELNEKHGTLQKKVGERYASWASNLRKRFNLDSAGVKLPNADLPTAQIKSRH